MRDGSDVVSLRQTRPSKEMAYVTIQDNEVRWHASQMIAEQWAEQSLLDAKNDGYPTTVFVLKCLKQGNQP